MKSVLKRKACHPELLRLQVSGGRVGSMTLLIYVTQEHITKNTTSGIREGGAELLLGTKAAFATLSAGGVGVSLAGAVGGASPSALSRILATHLVLVSIHTRRRQSLQGMKGKQTKSGS